MSQVRRYTELHGQGLLLLSRLFKSPFPFDILGDILGAIWCSFNETPWTLWKQWTV